MTQSTGNHELLLQSLLCISTFRDDALLRCAVCLALNQMEWFNKQDKAQDKHQVLPRTDQNDVAGTDDGVDDDDDDDDD